MKFSPLLWPIANYNSKVKFHSNWKWNFVRIDLLVNSVPKIYCVSLWVIKQVLIMTNNNLEANLGSTTLEVKIESKILYAIVDR